MSGTSLGDQAKGRIAKRIAILLAIGALCAAPAMAQGQRAGSVEAARYAMEELGEHRFAAVEARFDSQMSAALPVDHLANVWKSVEAEVGAFQKVRGVVVSGQQMATIILVCQFERTNLDAVFTFNSYGQIAALYFRPSALAAWTPPPYAQPQKFAEIPVAVQTGPWRLPGSLAMPRGHGPFPAIVLVPGSGPEDMDETIGSSKPFKDLAWGLASRSIAVLRYTKRTTEYGTRSSANFATFTVNDEIVDDARSAVRLLEHQPGIDPHRIFVLGHSLGATVGPRIAEEDTEVAGLVLMAGAVTPVERLAVGQVRAIDSSESMAPEIAHEQIATVEQEVKEIESPKLKPGLMLNFLGALTPSSYWLDLRNYNPALAAARLRIPILFMQGGRDYQVPPGELELWKKALAGHRNAEYELFPALNHLFESSGGPTGPAEYLKPGHMDEKAIVAIATWVQEQGMKK